MTESAPETTVTAEFVPIRFKETGAVGTAPAGAVAYYEARGYERITDEEYATLQVDPLNPAGVDMTPGTPTFDPSAEGVSAKNVAEYLKGLDTATPDGQAEYDRVVKAEQDGANRTSAFPS